MGEVVTFPSAFDQAFAKWRHALELLREAEQELTRARNIVAGADTLYRYQRSDDARPCDSE